MLSRPGQQCMTRRYLQVMYDKPQNVTLPPPAQSALNQVTF